jgi:hypothetical protein
MAQSFSAYDGITRRSARVARDRPAAFPLPSSERSVERGGLTVADQVRDLTNRERQLREMAPA